MTVEIQAANQLPVFKLLFLILPLSALAAIIKLLISPFAIWIIYILVIYYFFSKCPKSKKKALYLQQDELSRHKKKRYNLRQFSTLML